MVLPSSGIVGGVAVQGAQSIAVYQPSQAILRPVHSVSMSSALGVGCRDVKLVPVYHMLVCNTLGCEKLTYNQ